MHDSTDNTGNHVAASRQINIPEYRATEACRHFTFDFPDFIQLLKAGRRSVRLPKDQRAQENRECKLPQHGVASYAKDSKPEASGDKSPRVTHNVSYTLASKEAGTQACPVLRLAQGRPP